MTVPEGVLYCTACHNPVPDGKPGRDGCVQCGSRAFGVNFSLAVGVAVDSWSAVAQTHHEPTDVATRLSHLAKELDDLSGPHVGPSSGDDALRLSDRLRRWFVNAYLKDAIKFERPTQGQAIEKAVTDTPLLALSADLANGHKHPQQGQQPRSGSWPVWRPPALYIDDQGYALRVAVEHNGLSHDGLTLARQVLAAWTAL